MSRVNSKDFVQIQFQIKEAADFLGVTKGKVEVWLRAGMLHCYKIGGKTFIHRSDLEGFSAKRQDFQFAIGQSKEGFYVNN